MIRIVIYGLLTCFILALPAVAETDAAVKGPQRNLSLDEGAHLWKEVAVVCCFKRGLQLGDLLERRSRWT